MANHLNCRGVSELLEKLGRSEFVLVPAAQVGETEKEDYLQLATFQPKVGI